MFINEYGNPDEPAVILLAPMMVSGSDLYERMSPYFHGSYYFISPDQGGHGKAGNYISADEEYRILKEYLIEKGIRMFRKRKQKLATTQEEASPTLVKMYGYDFARMMTKNFSRITPEDIDAICHACCHYDLRKLTDEEQKKLHLDFGDKDFDWMYSKKSVPVYMPDAELVLRAGYQHCGYMAAHPAEHVAEIEQFISQPVE